MQDELTYEKMLRNRLGFLWLAALALLLILLWCRALFRKPDFVWAGGPGWAALALGLGVLAFLLIRLMRTEVWCEFSDDELKKRNTLRVLVQSLPLALMLWPFSFWLLPTVLHACSETQVLVVPARIADKRESTLNRDCATAFRLRLELRGRTHSHRFCNPPPELWDKAQPGMQVKVRGQGSPFGFAVEGVEL